MVHPHNDSIWRTEDAEYHRGQGRIVGAHSGDVGHPRSRMPYCDSASATAFCDLVVLEVLSNCVDCCISRWNCFQERPCGNKLRTGPFAKKKVWNGRWKPSHRGVCLVRATRFPLALVKRVQQQLAELVASDLLTQRTPERARGPCSNIHLARQNHPGSRKTSSPCCGRG
jgi:hypothetical protein